MGVIDDLMLADSALPDFGPKPLFPCSTPDQVHYSWMQLHRMRRRPDEDGFQSAPDVLEAAADAFGFRLDDQLDHLDPEGTDDVAASYPQMALSSVDRQVDRLLALAGKPTARPRRDPYGPVQFSPSVPRVRRGQPDRGPQR